MEKRTSPPTAIAGLLNFYTRVRKSIEVWIERILYEELLEACEIRFLSCDLLWAILQKEIIFFFYTLGLRFLTSQVRNFQEQIDGILKF